jgi:hypothetical protein
MNDQAPVPQPIDEWNQKFRNLMTEAQTQQLFAPQVLFILQTTVNEIQHQINNFLITHEHTTEKE